MEDENNKDPSSERNLRRRATKRDYEEASSSSSTEKHECFVNKKRIKKIKPDEASSESADVSKGGSPSSGEIGNKKDNNTVSSSPELPFNENNQTTPVIILI